MITSEIDQFFYFMYLCDFAKRCPLSFRLNSGDSQCSRKKNQGASCLARCQRRAQAQTYPWVGG